MSKEQVWVWVLFFLTVILPLSLWAGYRAKKEMSGPQKPASSKIRRLGTLLIVLVTGWFAVPGILGEETKYWELVTAGAVGVLLYYGQRKLLSAKNADKPTR